MKLLKAFMEVERAQGSWILSGLAIIFVLLFLSYCSQLSTVEGFQLANYPEALTDPLLHGCYDTTEYAGLEPNTYAENSRNYPVFPANHQGTNNTRYWCRPMNGTCTPADVCTNLYKPTGQSQWKEPKPPPIGGKARVNYYISDNNEQGANELE
jgi:hypothetical protein